MAAKLLFVVGVLGFGGYLGHTMMNHDPSVVSLSRDQIETKLVDAKTVIPRRNGPGEISIWGTSRSSKGVSLVMRYSEASPLIQCQAVITEVTVDQNRVSADCGNSTAGTSAIGQTQDALRAPMFAEHIQATLEGRPFDRSKVDSREQAVVLGNIGGMRREAMTAADEQQRDQATKTP